MSLHRNTGKVVRTSLVMLLLSALAAGLPSLLALVDREFVLGPWFWYLTGAVMAVFSLGSLYSTLRHEFRLEAADTGLVVRCAEIKADLPWSSVAAVTIERPHYLDGNASPAVILWLAPGVEVKAKPNYRTKDGSRAGFQLISLDDLVESPDEVVATLRRYGGEKVAVLARPTR
ncbi:hypothetical protein [Catellatospora tritici]|uniref:hypothetical protein n=1 Tax=Catellatospora tritici TaxID=2851566 RepID=UPI001C2CCC4E|nr:hypothetical protein [Catellatospora tritici]MBV1853310.1 hypothetical protein [Catellatospora tritici]